MAKQDYINFTTPLGVARYPKLEKQDTYEGKEVGFKIGLIFKDQKDLDAIEAKIAEAATAGGLNPSKLRFSPIREDKEGNAYVEFKSFKPRPVFGPKGQKLSEDTRSSIGGGSILRLNVALTSSNKGVTGYFNSIQIAKLVKKGEGGGFDQLEGYDDEPTGDEGFGDLPDADIDI